mmetsp:Transcript_49359/g.88707  ORF Transcript_49359/g.88707 Transcript_49359/m.88707 type:complete len:114 (+) Transcript_49359:41-382(+)
MWEFKFRCNLRALCQTLYVWKGESYVLSAKLDGQKPRKFENTPLKQRCVFRLSGLQGPKNLYKQVSNGQRAQDINIEHTEDFKGTSNRTRRSHLTVRSLFAQLFLQWNHSSNF